MPLRRAYAPTLPEYYSFLFAPVGEEVEGIPLSVLSALSRLDLDPRDEAARLSHLTKETAAEQLASMIARLSDRCWTLSEAHRIPVRLIERLPMSNTAGKPNRIKPGVELTPGKASPFLMYLALLIAMLVGLTASGILSFWRFSILRPVRTPARLRIVGERISLILAADECLITFPVAGGIFGVARLASKLNELLDTGQIGPWRVGHWIDFKHTEIRIKFLTVTDGEVARRSCLGAY
jgi:hypothetical protein